MQDQSSVQTKINRIHEPKQERCGKGTKKNTKSQVSNLRFNMECNFTRENCTKYRVKGFAELFLNFADKQTAELRLSPNLWSLNVVETTMAGKTGSKKQCSEHNEEYAPIIYDTL
jgi:hypothetical protein